MPLQVQTLIVPEYTEVIAVPATAELITEEALANTAIALGNRIEFVRQLQTTNEGICFFRDDFIHVQRVNAGTTPLTEVWHGDTAWRAAELLAPFNVMRINSAGGDIGESSVYNNPGRARFDSLTGPAGANFSKFAGLAGEGLPNGNFIEGKCIVKPFSVASGMRFEFGLQASAGGVAINQSNAAAISFLFDPAESDNWLCKSSLSAAASAHYTDSGIAPAPAGAPHKLIIRRVQLDEEDPEAFKWQWLIQPGVGSVFLVAEKTNGDEELFIPPFADQMQYRFAVEVPDQTGNDYWEVDWVSGEFAINR